MATGAIAIGGVMDKRVEDESVIVSDYANRNLTTLHDPNVCFEEYLYYARLSRQYEKGLSTAGRGYSKLLHPKSAMKGLKDEKNDSSHVDSETSDSATSYTWPTQQEWFYASRAMRTATWGATFYLITTDILGPFSVPWSIVQLGWGPGTALYTVFGILAGYGGYQLWHCFLSLDSDRYPVKVYGDLAYRIFGNWARQVCNILQSVQFFLNVSLLILTYGQSISELSQGQSGTAQLCFVVCLLVFMLAGCILGQIRTLQRFSYIANWAFWLNVVVIIFTMAIIPNIPPNRVAVSTSYGIPKDGPITRSAGLPEGYSFQQNMLGLSLAVFAYGGATLFCELMSEMRRPDHFIKGLIAADVVIYVIYMAYGLYVYGFYGNYTFNPSFQGISDYAWSAAANAIGVVSALIAAALYGNIGIKILYASVGEELLHLPRLTTRAGKWLWAGIVPVYWILAFVIGAAIPQLSNFQGLVGSLAILQFTYTFPPILCIGLYTKRDAILPEEEFDPSTGKVKRVDGGFRRYWRGFKKHLPLNIWNVIYALGAATTAVLGIYSSIVLIIQGYRQNPALTSFSCKSPTG